MSEAGGLPLGIVDGLEIDDDRVVTIAHDDPLRGHVGRIDLLMWNEGGDIDEVPGPGVRLVFQSPHAERRLLSPPISPSTQPSPQIPPPPGASRTSVPYSGRSAPS